MRDGLITVHNTLKTIHGMDPEKIFFILPANLTILTTIASGFAVVRLEHQMPRACVCAHSHCLAGCNCIISTGALVAHGCSFEPSLMLPANITLMSTSAAPFSLTASTFPPSPLILWPQVTSEPCSILAGVEVFYKTHDITC